MLLNFILLIVGFVVLIKGADILVDGSASIAKKLGLSSLMIGLTIVSLGTSAPELIVNIFSSIQGSSDIGMGNIIGSNISNFLLVLGVTALFASLKIDGSIIKKQIPFSVLAALALFFLINSSLLNGVGPDGLMRSGGLVLILFFSIFLYYTFTVSKKKKIILLGKDDMEVKVKVLSPLMSTFMVIAGSLALFIGGKLIVDNSVSIAEFFGLSEALIGLTIVAIGTSLPELAASISAVRKNKIDMAVGNVVGSNIFNILWVLGLSAVINPIEFNPVMNFDIIFLIAISLILISLFYVGRKHHLTKKEGCVLLGLYLFYLIFIVIRG
jgi:cation:H+ antiporter